MLEIEEFHQEFIQSILIGADARGLMKSEVFLEETIDSLMEDGELGPNCEIAECKKRGIDVSGYDFDEERKLLTIILSEFYQSEKIETIYKKNIDAKFRNAENFIKENQNKFYENLEETSSEYSMSYNIYNKFMNRDIEKIRFFLLSDGVTTSTLKEIPKKKYKSGSGQDLEFSYRIIDIDYLYKLQMSNFKDEGFSIDVDLPYLKAPVTDEKAIDKETGKDMSHESYLAIMPGKLIAEIYDNYGQRLLEQNVRTFLQFRGKVNKGLRNTIEHYPLMFFAYNNGITATASKLEINDIGHITKIYDFQIVNGGQTTSSIYAAWKNNKLDLSNINVQMKLSVVKKFEGQSEFVSNVAKYANTQNKVNESDFFSNSPFHKEMKKHSKRIWAPASDGRQKKTRWYYERVRGEYLNEQAYLTKAKKKAYQLESPKNQLIDKTFLAKSEIAWKEEPYKVALGAQKCFKEFAQTVTKKLEKDNLAITEDYFKEAVAKIIIFRHLEKRVSKSIWYNGGYRAQIIAYTLSYFSMLLKKKKLFLDFGKVWKEQEVSESLSNLLIKIAATLYPVLLEGTAGDANIGMWARKESCWKKLKEVDVDLKIPENLVVDKEKQLVIKKDEQKSKKLMKGIDATIFVYGYKEWPKLFKHYKKYKDVSDDITETQFEILKKMANQYPDYFTPSDKQCKLLLKVYEKSKLEGIVL